MAEKKIKYFNGGLEVDDIRKSDSMIVTTTMTREEILKELEQEAKEDRKNSDTYYKGEYNFWKDRYIEEKNKQIEEDFNKVIKALKRKPNNMNSTINLLNETISNKKNIVKNLEMQKDALIRNITRTQQCIDETNDEVSTLQKDLRTLYEEGKVQGTCNTQSSQEKGTSFDGSKNTSGDIFSNERV